MDVVVTSKPLRGEAVFDEHLAASRNGLAVHLVSYFGVDVLHHPHNIEALFVGYSDLLLS